MSSARRYKKVCCYHYYFPYFEKVRKALAHCRQFHGFRPPYRLVLDGDFVQGQLVITCETNLLTAALEGQIRILDQLPKLMQAETVHNIYQ